MRIISVQTINRFYGWENFKNYCKAKNETQFVISCRDDFSLVGIELTEIAQWLREEGILPNNIKLIIPEDYSSEASQELNNLFFPQKKKKRTDVDSDDHSSDEDWLPTSKAKRSKKEDSLSSPTSSTSETYPSVFGTSPGILAALSTKPSSTEISNSTMPLEYENHELQQELDRLRLAVDALVKANQDQLNLLETSHIDISIADFIKSSRITLEWISTGSRFVRLSDLSAENFSLKTEINLLQNKLKLVLQPMQNEILSKQSLWIDSAEAQDTAYSSQQYGLSN